MPRRSHQGILRSINALKRIFCHLLNYLRFSSLSHRLSNTMTLPKMTSSRRDSDASTTSSVGKGKRKRVQSIELNEDQLQEFQNFMPTMADNPVLTELLEKTFTCNPHPVEAPVCLD